MCMVESTEYRRRRRDVDAYRGDGLVVALERVANGYMQLRRAAIAMAVYP